MSEKAYEEVCHNSTTLAIILRGGYASDDVKFFTPKHYSQQIGFLPFRQNEIITAHVHNEVARSITMTLEVLFVRKGKVKVNLYGKNKEYIDSRILEQGDLILLCEGGHGFEFLEDTEMIEVKQGPYAGMEDKERFEGIENNRRNCYE